MLIIESIKTHISFLYFSSSIAKWIGRVVASRYSYFHFRSQNTSIGALDSFRGHFEDFHDVKVR